MYDALHNTYQHDNVDVRLVANEVKFAKEAFEAGDIKRAMIHVRLAATFEKGVFVKPDGTVVPMTD